MEAIDNVLYSVIPGVAPPLEMTVSEWADENRYLSAEASAEPGKYYSSRAHYQKGMMDALNEPGVERICYMCSAQIGKTIIIENTLAYYVAEDPCPIMIVQPTLGMAETFSKNRLTPLLRDNPSVGEKINSGSRDSSNTILEKSFPGGAIVMCGANSPASLASRSIRVLLMDEIDRFPTSAGEEGDPSKLAEKRTTTFWNRKILSVSTPTDESTSRIAKEFEISDKRYFHISCPTCKHEQTLKFKQLKWEGEDLMTVRYECEECGSNIKEILKNSLIRNGRWIKTAPESKIAGFHINELYSPWVKWREIVESFLEAKKDPNLLKTWVNTSLGEVWKEKGVSQPEWKTLYNRRDSWKIGTAPKEVVFAVASIDIQKDRFEVLIMGYGRELNSYPIDYRVIHCETSEIRNWNKHVLPLISELVPHESGALIPIEKVGIDTGYNTQVAYDFCRGKSKVMALKGSDTAQVPLGTPKPVEVRIRGNRGARRKRGVNLWPVGSSIIKQEIYGWLGMEQPTDSEIKEEGFPRGYCHFPEYDEEFFKMLCSEKLMEKKVKGFSKYYWEKTRDRNEILDLYVYARACSIALMADRWTEEEWSRRESEIGVHSEIVHSERKEKISPVKKEKTKKKKFGDWK